jgi:hypothetical protein
VSGALLAAVLRDPGSASGLASGGWNALVAVARAERLIGTLAFCLEGVAVPASVEPILADARDEAAREKRQAQWEADRAAAALASTDVPVILLKGTAYAAAGLRAGEGRFIGDLDILVPRDRLDDVEAAILGAGWEWVKPDPYDNDYYRRWMHELPPMIHKDRDRMIDIHHTILPLTARQTPDAAAMIANAVAVGQEVYVLSPDDRICHAAAHMLADGDLAGGLRNLWDIHCLLADHGDRGALMTRAGQHGLRQAVARAIRLADAVYGLSKAELGIFDRLLIARLLARDDWGRETRKLLRFVFFVRSHWLRMPPFMLARHLWTKWRKGHRPA